MIRGNILASNYQGVYCGCTDGSAIIELNLIANSTRSGVDINAQATIRNNTFTNNDVAITLYDLDSSDVTVVHNNIENCSQHSIYLLRTTGNFDATNNWWGTTDTQTINMTILDFKYDFNLGKVTFVPFLTEQNPNALPDSSPELPADFVIPEFSSIILLSLFLTATLLAVVARKRLVRVPVF